MEYSIMFQDNILSQNFNNVARGITGWIKDNRQVKDPNAFEMANVFLFAGKYRQEGYDIDMAPLDEMWDIRSKDFANCGISENNFVYKICEDAYNSAKQGRALVNDENSHHALRKMAGIGLWLKQQQRDGEQLHYENLQEYQLLIESSKTLKSVHPDLFGKYKFDKNIDVLYNLIERNLDEQTKNQLLEAKDSLLNPVIVDHQKTEKPDQDAR